MERLIPKPYLWRFLIIFAGSLIIIYIFSEIGFNIQEYNIDRAPDTIELTIPAGTAEKVAQGFEVPSIPSEMVFVLGDILLVHNQDNVYHELGPVLVPPESSASIPMDLAENFAYSCSFRPSQYLGVEVIEPTTWKTRLLALALAAPPTAVVAFLYSLAIRPIILPQPTKP